MAEMTDDEFLRYCETHAETPRCGFVPAQLKRLCEMAGAKPAIVAYWDKQENRVIDCTKADILALVKKARGRLVTT